MAIPELLRALQLAGCIVTIDALGCQTKIASEICHAGADYVLALKGNQSTPHEEVKIFLEGAEAGDFKGVHGDFLETNESAHGRSERRRYWITEDIAWLTHYGGWAGLRCAGMVESTREIQGQSTTGRRFYIAPAGAEPLDRAIRWLTPPANFARPYRAESSAIHSLWYKP